jgi:excisionase family DNA binding protein
MQKVLSQKALQMKMEAQNAPCSLALGPRQAGVVAGLGHDVIYDAIRLKKLKARKLGRRTVIMREDLEEWLKSQPPLELNENTAHRRRGRSQPTAGGSRRERAEPALQPAGGYEETPEHEAKGRRAVGQRKRRYDSVLDGAV